MRLRQWAYFVGQALNNMSSNRLIHGLGIGTLAASLLIFGTFLLLFVNVNTWIQGWGSSLSMSVYLREGINEEQKQKVEDFIQTVPNAEVERFVSKEDALRDLRKALGSQAGLLESLSENPLPASFELVLTQSDNRGAEAYEIKEGLERLPGVADVHYSKEWMERLEGLLDMVRLVGFVIGGLLCMGILFIVTNTIKLTIYSRQEEIEILKLVGATDWYVKLPFLMEGTLQGLIGGGLSILILYVGYLLLSTKELQILSFTVLDIVFLPQEYTIGLLALSFGLGLGGSFIAVGRFFDI
jgi:cell division transport system permease protein